MIFLSVCIEHNSLEVNRLFTYKSKKAVQPGCRVRVPFGPQRLVGIVNGITEDPGTDNIKEIIEVIDQTPLVNEELMDLAAHISDISGASLASVYKTMLPPAFKPASSFKPIVQEDWLTEGTAPEKLTKRQQEVLDQIRPLLPCKAASARKLAGAMIKKLLDMGAFKLESRPAMHHLGLEVQPDQPPALMPAQKEALDQIRASDKEIILLHGVTGSGKTEIFLQMAKDAMDQGRQVLFLVPEIGLTPMMVRRVCARFGSRIAVYHSGLSAQEKFSQFELVRTGQVSIVVGTRSACFLPFANLGLILMDEEHDSSYKQDSMPRYHARDAAIWRGAYHQCKVLLASATPSLESYARAWKGVYGLVTMTERINHTMPEIRFVDLRKETLHQGLSTTMLEAIRDRLAKKEQVILLLNRRGYLPVVRCLDCRELRTCPDCGTPLSYHKKENRLACHICGSQYPFDPVCPHCHSHHHQQTGMGTERLEETICSLFPDANIVRMDADSTRKKNSHQKLLEQFEKEGDILVGTQMVAKGLDFPRVTLVGILQADNALMRMDYRAAEQAYQMIEQASGRAGRDSLPGQVLVETFQPDHYVMQAVRQHNYLDFFRREMQYRRMGVYPPYTYLCTLVFTHEKEEKAMERAEEARQMLEADRILGPVPISMRQQKARVRLVIKDKDAVRLRQQVWHVIHHLPSKGVKLDVNLHPLTLEE